MVVLFLCFSSHVLYQGYTIWKLISPDGRTTHTGIPISKVLLGEQIPGQLPGQIVHDMKEKQSSIRVSHRNLGEGGGGVLVTAASIAFPDSCILLISGLSITPDVSFAWMTLQKP